MIRWRSLVNRGVRWASALRFNSRMLLLLLIVGGELGCLTAGLLWFGAWLSADLMAHMQREALELNQSAAASTADIIRRMKPESLRPGSADWERVQNIVERTRLPNDGFLTIIDGADGRIICHPELRQNPVLVSMQLGGQVLARREGDATIASAAVNGATASGTVMMPDGQHLVAVYDVPDLQVKVLAHQRGEGIEQVIGHFNAGVWSVGMIVVLVMTAGTVSLTTIIVRRYEHWLAELNRGLERQVQQRSRALVRTREAVIFGLARLAESRHECTGEHLERIRMYVEVLAREMAREEPALTDDMIHTIAVASSLHDIGKVAIPDEVLLKPGKLTPRQREVMRRHTIVGGECLQAIKRRLGEDDFLTTACQIALSHHERWNGGGYPFGLKGEEIPLASRIVALADVYDALTSERVYKCAMPHEDARQMLVKGSGKQFDPRVVEAFLRVESEFARIATQHRAVEAHAPPTMPTASLQFAA